MDIDLRRRVVHDVLGLVDDRRPLRERARPEREEPDNDEKPGSRE